MNKFIYKTPEGFNDTLYDECLGRIEIENQIRSIFRGYGYFEVDTPTLEYYDLFSGRVDALSQERMFKLFDLKGRILVLRPDITVPIMRMAVTKIGDGCYPLRLSYFGNVFRNDLKNLINCEYRQAGIEILRTDSIIADAEAIAIAIKSLLKSGIDDFRIDIGQVKLFKALTSSIADEDTLEEIRQSVANKDKYSIEKLISSLNMDNEKKENIMRLPWLFGNPEILDEIKDYFKSDDEKAAIDELINLVHILKSWGYEKYISIDLGMVHSLNYYNGIVFRGYAVECGFSICWGGRYDSLSQNFDTTICATGCALGINRIVEVLKRKGKLGTVRGADYLIISQNGNLKNIEYKIAEALRDWGYSVEDSLIDNEYQIEEYCRVKGINKIIKVINEATVKIFDVKEKKEEEYDVNYFTK